MSSDIRKTIAFSTEKRSLNTYPIQSVISKQSSREKYSLSLTINLCLNRRLLTVNC
ncbi:MAG: hypothetical protein AAF298_23335 [Cyanobacteria bacterium P01_A01_bin.40]